MANELVRIQVRKNSAEHEWADVGNKTGDEPVPVSVSSISLPSGASTEAKQDDIIAELDKKADLTETQPVEEQNPLDISTLATAVKQLPDGHEVEVNNLPADYPLPAGQVVTLTPPAAISGFATEGTLSDVVTELQVLNSLVPAVYDYVGLSYTGDNLTTVIFNTGGAGGATVSTLTLAYTGARLDSVTKT